MLQISEHVGPNLLSLVPLPIIERLKAVGLLFFGLGIVYRLTQDGELYIMYASYCRYADGTLIDVMKVYSTALSSGISNC